MTWCRIVNGRGFCSDLRSRQRGPAAFEFESAWYAKQNARAMQKPTTETRTMAKSILNRLLGFTLGAGIALTAFGAHAGATLDRVMKNGTMMVATSGKWPPQAFLNDKHEFDGFDIDVAKEIARRLGVKVAFDTPQFSLMTGGHWHGRWDLSVLSVTPTKSRAELLDFPAVYYYSPYVFVVNKDSKAKTRADLNGKVIGVEAG